MNRRFGTILFLRHKITQRPAFQFLKLDLFSNYQKKILNSSNNNEQYLS